MKRFLRLALSFALMLNAPYLFGSTAATPTFSPAGGSYTSVQTVTLASSTPSSTIYYTTDGSTPTTSSPVYNSPLTISETQTLKAIATASGYSNSGAGSASYTVSIPTSFGLMTITSSVAPTPFPSVVRNGPGTGWWYLEPSSGSYTWSGLDGYRTQAAAHGAKNLYTFYGVPTWANGGSGHVAPPTDVDSGNAQIKAYTDTMMQHDCGVSSPPSSPLIGVCNTDIEGWNEFNGDGYWTGTYLQLAKLMDAVNHEVKIYCGDCKMGGGSVSLGGDGSHVNGEPGNGFTAMLELLTDWASLPNPSLPDYITFHAYPSRDNFANVPFPTTLASNNNSVCTTGNTPNGSCRSAISSQVSTMAGSAVLQNAAISAWASHLGIEITEGGYGVNMGLGDGSNFNYSDANVGIIRGAYAAQWMATLAHQAPLLALWYGYSECAWGTAYGSGTTCAESPTDPVIPAGNTAVQLAFAQMQTWLNSGTLTGTLTSSAVTGGNVWTLPITIGGHSAQIIWFDQWLGSYTQSTAFTTQQTLAGTMSSTGGSVTLGMQPMLLTSGPLWNGILAPTRAVDWSSTNPGVVGGIPSASWTQSGSTIPSSASASTIQSALNSCGTNHVILLGAGTFNLTAGLNMPPNCVLRGSGPNSTFLVFTDSTACGGEGGQICFIDSAGWYYGSTAVSVGNTNSAAWTADYTSGATTIQLSNVGSSGITNGQYIILDQQNDNPATPSTSNTTGMLVCDNTSATDGCSLEGGAPGRNYLGVDRNLQQFVKVVSGCATACAGTGPFTITITPGLYGQKWNSGATPGAWWSSSSMQNSGVENLSINSSGETSGTGGCANDTSCSAFFLNNAFNCWVSNVRSIGGNRNHVWLWESAHNTIQNSYFFGTLAAAQQSYGIEFFIAGDNLVENNVFQQISAPTISGPGMGNVTAYNFGINNLYYQADWMQIAPAWLHDAGANYNLYEGNISTGYWGDAFHGTGGANTAFRNYGVGWEPGKSEDTVPFQNYSYNRFDNAIGNVFGCNNTTSTYPGNCGSPYHTTYQGSAGAGASAEIYDLGSGNSETGTNVVSDPYVATSMMRWGNYDVKNAATRFVSGEVPSGLSDGYANAVPGSTTLPASFFTTKPSWWGSAAWPVIGPDVTTGTVPGVASHVALNPAAQCYFTTMSGPQDGSGSVLTFNPSACYNASVVTPPTSLFVITIQ